MLSLHAEDINRETNILTFFRQARILALHGFIFFLPCSVAFSQICLTLLALAYLIEVALTRNFHIPPTPVNSPLAAFFVVSLVTALFSTNVSKSTRNVVADFVLVSVFFLCYIEIKDISQLKKLTGLLGLYVTLVSLYGVMQHFWEVDVFRLSGPIGFLKHVNDDLTAPVRVSGFSSYMTFSGQLAMAIPIIFALFLSTKALSRKIFWGISLVLTLLVLLWTYTRSAWIGTICAFIPFGYLRKKTTFIVLLLAGILLVSLTILQPDILDRSLIARSLSAFSTKENMERVYTWKSTLSMIRDHLLTGIGKGNYSRFAREYRRKEYPDFEFSSYAHAHNNILQVTVTGGIFTLCCFLWLWAVIFTQGYRSYQQASRENPVLRTLSLGFLGAIIAFFVQGLFECNFGDAESVMMMWVVVAFSLKLQHLMNTKEES